MAISPDGNRIAYVAASGGIEQLFLRHLNSFDVSVVTGSEGARYPFFSPDGSQVAFFADGQLQRVSIDGENPTRICDVDNVGRGGSWGPDDTIVFVGGSSGLMRVDAAGGTPEPLTSGDPVVEAKRHAWPRFVPDGRAAISSIDDPGGLPELAVLVLDTGEWHRLGSGTQGQYLPSGHLVYHAGRGAEGELHAVAFDLDQVTTLGAPVSVLDGIFRAGPYRVTAKIGEGGMGGVYRAKDTKLDRDVALQVLPRAFTDDSDRLARLEREAQVLASWVEELKPPVPNDELHRRDSARMTESRPYRRGRRPAASSTPLHPSGPLVAHRPPHFRPTSVSPVA